MKFKTRLIFNTADESAKLDEMNQRDEFKREQTSEMSTAGTG